MGVLVRMDTHNLEDEEFQASLGYVVFKVSMDLSQYHEMSQKS